MIFDSSLDYYGPSSFIIYLLSESSNLLFCFIIAFILFGFKKLNSRELYFWLVLFSIAALVNIFIAGNQFPDIGGYLRCVRDFRDNFIFDEVGCQLVTSGGGESFALASFKRTIPALFYSIIPMPSIATHASLGMINKVYLLFAYVLIKPKIDPSYIPYLILSLLLPSMLLYSSLGLRDNLIFCIQLALMFSIIANRFLLSTVLVSILLAVKIQNGIIFIFLYLGVFFFRAHTSHRMLLMYCIVVFSGVLIFSDALLATLNYFKLAFLTEANAIGSVTRQNLVPFTSVLSLLVSVPLSFIEGLFKPFPYSFSSLIFFVESLIQLGIVFLLIRGRVLRYAKSPEFILVLITICLGITLNSLVIENSFTYLRYKYTFIYIFIVYLLIKKSEKEAR